MIPFQLVPIEDLRRRLRAALGRDSLLCQRFDAALHRQDEARIAAAMDALRLYPAAVQEQVEAVMLDWLQDGPHGTGMLDHAGDRAS
jgi:hypothetical protein